MSLGNEKDIIIPGTTGLITATKNEANLFNKNSVSQEVNNTYLANQIRGVGAVYNIINGRAHGIELRDLVDPARISNNQERTSIETPEKNEKQAETTRAYESWFRE